MIGSFFFIKLILGVLSEEYSKEKEKAKKRFDLQKLKETTQLENAYKNYILWIQQAEINADDDEDNSQKELSTELGDDVKEMTGESATHKQHLECECFFNGIRWLRHKNHLIRRRVHSMIKSNFFYWLVIVLVFLNTLVLASEYHGQPKWLDDFQCNKKLLTI